MSQKAVPFVADAPASVKFTEIETDLFWNKVDKNGPLPDQSNPHYAGLDHCWTWTGGKTGHGYGAFSYKGRYIPAHRMSYMLHNGSIPQSHVICHKCDNPPCVNPSHLFLGTPLDNMNDKSVKGRSPTGDRNGARVHIERMPRGETHGMSKLTNSLVREIRQTGYTETAKSMSLRMGVSKSLIKMVRRGVIWRHVASEGIGASLPENIHVGTIKPPGT